MIRTSSRVEIVLEQLFPARHKIRARKLLERQVAENLVVNQHSSPRDMDRIRFGVLKLSGGTLEGLQEAIDLAKTDWRDLLMVAGFGTNLDEHTKWYNENYRPERWWRFW